MGKKPKFFEKTISEIAQRMKDTRYAIRGTASLVLQDIDMNIDDIDIIANEKTSLLFNDKLKDFINEKVKYKKSEKIKSYYGKFTINKIQIEIMGCMQIKNKENEWSNPFDASSDEVTSIKLKDQLVKVTTIQTELMMFSLLGRWNAFHKIKRQIDLKNQRRLL